jgi:hypothetical protein
MGTKLDAAEESTVVCVCVEGGGGGDTIMECRVIAFRTKQVLSDAQ